MSNENSNIVCLISEMISKWPWGLQCIRMDCWKLPRPELLEFPINSYRSNTWLPPHHAPFYWI